MTRDKQGADASPTFWPKSKGLEPDLQPEPDEFPKFPPRWNIRPARPNPILFNPGPCPSEQHSEWRRHEGYPARTVWLWRHGRWLHTSFRGSSGLPGLEGKGRRREDSRVCERRYPWLQGRAPTLQRPRQAGLRAPFSEREEKVRQEISRSDTKSAQSQGLARQSRIFFTNPFLLLGSVGGHRLSSLDKLQDLL